MILRTRLRAAMPRNLLWKARHVRLAYWDERNFGDLFSPEAVSSLFGTKVVFSGFGAADLIAVGSLLELAEDRVTDLVPTVWGSGFIREGGPWAGAAMDFRAVRGKLTQRRVEAAADRSLALGDPGILAGYVYPHLKNVSKKYGTSLIPHFHEMEEAVVTRLRQAGKIHVIDPRDDPSNVAAQIAASRCVLSSSLHGLIFADGLNVPNAWTPISGKLEGGTYKFRDYYSVYDIDPTPRSVAKALEDVEELVATWKERPGIRDLQRELLSAFPSSPTGVLRKHLKENS